MNRKLRPHGRPAALALLLISLTACGDLPQRAASPPSQPRPQAASGSAQTQPNAPGLPAPIEPAPHPPPKQFHLGPAALSLVGQAHKQTQSGDYGQATATLERALRIEPNNPLLWIELGAVRLGEKNPEQAEAMGRKAVALATGDAQAQSAAWQLVAESLRVRNRNPEAAEAQRKAAGLTPR